MKIRYQTLWLELPYEVTEVIEFTMKEVLNQHTEVTLTAVIEDEKADQYVNQGAEHQTLLVGDWEEDEEKPVFFTGRITGVHLFYNKGQAVIRIEALSYTSEWDIIKRSRSFQNQDLTYAQVIDEVLSGYQNSGWISKVETQEKIPGLLLQYEETDWEFLCRLTSHFGTFLMVDSMTADGRVYFGIPQLEYGTVAEDCDYRIEQNLGNYQAYIANENPDMMPQENICWRICTRQKLILGEQVLWQKVECQVTEVCRIIQGSELFYEVQLRRSDGVKSVAYGNQRIIGMSLPAVIRERKGNQLRVQFTIDPEYRPGNNCYFTFAIETTSWYCIPEAGSLIHIYFYNEYEQICSAVHAIQKNYAARAKKTAVGDKSFCAAAGQEMRLTETGMEFMSDESKACVIRLSRNGNLSMTGNNLAIGTCGKIDIKANTVILKSRKCTTENGIIAGIIPEADNGAAIDENKCVVLCPAAGIYIKAKTLNMKGTELLAPGVIYSDEALKEQDGEKRKEHNLAVMDEKDAKISGKEMVGALAALAGMVSVSVGLIALAPVSGGLSIGVLCTYLAGSAAVVFGATAGAVGISQIGEAGQGREKMNQGDFSQSSNFVRDQILGGSQEDFDNLMMISTVMAVSSSISFLLPDLIPKAGEGILALIKSLPARGGKAAVTAGVTAVVTTGIADINDGYLDISLETYAELFAKQATVSFVTAAIVEPLAQALIKGLPVQTYISNINVATGMVIGAKTAVGMGIDYATCRIMGSEYNATVSLVSQLAASIVMSIDPVNTATGSFYLEGEDLAFADLAEEDFRIKRIYNSVFPYEGMAGKKWMFNFESTLMAEEGNPNVYHVLCMDGHVETFLLKDGIYVNRKGESGRYQLKRESTGEYRFYGAAERRTWCYREDGRLTEVCDRRGNRMIFSYAGDRLERIVSFSGHEISLSYQNGRVVEIRDENGRKIQYRYEKKCLTGVCHVDQGYTSYEYDRNANITRVTDQNGNSYIRNEYDDAGRVITQYYPDGTKSTVTYRPEKRETEIYIEAFDATERYRYDRNYQVTHSYYEDGTVLEYGYDEWGNRIYEKDRKGNETRRVYDGLGHVIREELADGLVRDYEYNSAGDLIRCTSGSGEETVYEYDGADLVRETRKQREGVYSSIRYRRDRYGRVLERTDGMGNKTEYRYEKTGHHLPSPSRVTDACGQKVYYEYDEGGRKISIRTGYGTVDFAYNDRNDMTYTRDAKGGETRRYYDQMGNMIGLVSPNEAEDRRKWLYRYDAFNRLIEIKDPLGTMRCVKRDLMGNIVREIHPNGYAEEGMDGYGTSYEYDREGRKLRTVYADGSTERFFYDANGNLIKHVLPEDYQSDVDDGSGKYYEYDCRNRLVRIIDEDGTVEKEIVYDQSGRVTEETDAAGSVTFRAYDLFGNRTEEWVPVEEKEGETYYRLTRYEYDRNSNCVRERRGIGKVRRGEAPERFHDLIFEYDALNRLVSVKDQGGAQAKYEYDCLNQKTYESFRINEDTNRVIHYHYDAAGNLIEKREELEARFLKAGCKTDADRKSIVWAVTKYAYDRNGNCVKEVSPKGYEKQRVYDVLDRVKESYEIDKANGIYRKYQYRYDRVGNLLEREDLSCEEQTVNRKYRYDKKDRLTHYEDEAGGITRLFYDKNDRIVKVVKPEQYDENADDGAGTRYGYDSQGKVVSVVNALGEVVSEHEYDALGNVVKTVEGGALKTEYRYDLAGDCLEVYKGEGKARQGRAAQTFVYDARGNITGVCDGNGNRTEFLLDDWGRVTEIHTAEGGVEKYAYDYAGNLISTTDANGGVITYRYNSFGQVSKIEDQEGNTEYFYYDKEGNPETHVDRNGNMERKLYNMDGQLVYRCGSNETGEERVVNRYLYDTNGRLKEADGGGIAYQYEYTADGRIKRKCAAGKVLLEYEYDKNGNVKRLTNVSGNAVEYEYDEENRIRSVREEGKRLACYEYDALGRVKKAELGNGVKTEYGYTDEGQQESLVTVLPNGEVLVDYHYLYDGDGNCISRGGCKERNVYTYDQMNRLSSACYDGKTERYSYDWVGNRLSRETDDVRQLYEYNVKNQLMKIEEESGFSCYQYDRQGNLLSETGITEEKKFRYDELNRQIEVKAGERRQENHYDGEDLRYRIVENETVKQFLYDERKELLAEQEDMKKSWKYLVQGNDVVALGEKEGEKEQRSYYTQDEQRSTLFLLDEEQQIKKSYRYDAFGVIMRQTGELVNSVTYTGQMYDEVSGQYYLRARFYHPGIGRFTQEDPYRGDGLNLYAYCRNHPVKYVDPSGYVSLCPIQGMRVGDPTEGGSGATKNTGKVGDFTNVKDLDDFISRIPADAKELPWKEVPGGAAEGVKYKWTDSENNVWQVRAHSADLSAPVGSNANQGWIYRVEVRYGGKGKTYYIDSTGIPHMENVLNPKSPMYDENIANNTHIPFEQ